MAVKATLAMLGRLTAALTAAWDLCGGLGKNLMQGSTRGAGGPEGTLF